MPMNATHILHADRLAAYASYPAAIWAPIIFPLALAVVGQIIVYTNILVHRSCGRRLLPACGSDKSSASPSKAVDVPILLLMLSELIFAACCFSQCIVNWTARSFVGGLSACDFQALYASYYSFASPALCAITVSYAAQILTKPEQSPPWIHVSLTAVLIHAASFIIAALPLLGVSNYLFAVDYCVYDVASPMYAVLFLVWFSFCLIGAGRACAKVICGDKVSARGRLLVTLTCVYLFFMWLPSVLLACASFGIDDLAASKLGAALYGVQAIQLHTNQLVVPVLFGYLLRDQMHLATASMIEEVEKALRVTIGTFRDALSEEVRKGVKAQEVAMSEE